MAAFSDNATAQVSEYEKGFSILATMEKNKFEHARAWKEKVGQKLTAQKTKAAKTAVTNSLAALLDKSNKITEQQVKSAHEAIAQWKPYADDGKGELDKYLQTFVDTILIDVIEMAFAQELALGALHAVLQLVVAIQGLIVPTGLAVQQWKVLWAIVRLRCAINECAKESSKCYHQREDSGFAALLFRDAELRALIGSDKNEQLDEVEQAVAAWLVTLGEKVPDLLKIVEKKCETVVVFVRGIFTELTTDLRPISRGLPDGGNWHSKLSANPTLPEIKTAAQTIITVHWHQRWQSSTRHCVRTDTGYSAAAHLQRNKIWEPVKLSPPFLIAAFWCLVFEDFARDLENILFLECAWLARLGTWTLVSGKLETWVHLLQSGGGACSKAAL
eukprot:5352888-Amphidinium_carterae.2